MIELCFADRLAIVEALKVRRTLVQVEMMNPDDLPLDVQEDFQDFLRRVPDLIGRLFPEFESEFKDCEVQL